MPAGRVRSGLDIQTLSVLPDASQLCLTVDGNEAAFAVLSAPPPVTLEAPLVRPCEDTEALFFVKPVLTAVLPSVSPGVRARTMNDRVKPPPLKSPTISADIGTDSIDAVGVPRASVLCTIRPIINSEALFLPTKKLPLVAAVFVPSLDTVTVLQIIYPLAPICGLAFVVISPSSMGQITSPFSHVPITVAMHKAAQALSLVLDPLTLIDGAVGPLLHAETLTHVALPLAVIGSTTRECKRRPALHFIAELAL
mmetsp:Transcript_14347/g.31408  ORF Transcript_14347/g.31408 Transcript_14347/m.31408 type:complete len:253 (-) Transcript_14347:182-940(-)